MNIDDVNKAADAYLVDAQGSSATRLEFLKGLWALQSEIENGVTGYAIPDTESARDALATGQPLFLVSAPVIPAADYREAVGRIAAYVAETASLEPAQANALRDLDIAAVLTDDLIANAVRDAKLFVGRVSDAILEDSEGSALSRPTIAFVLLSALTPFMTAASAAAMDVLDESERSVWNSGDCPVCGSAAALGRMSESTALQGGARSLWCSLCHAEWGFERIRCARCGTRTHDKLKYTYEESDPAHRLHLCDTCHGYLKFTFENETDKPLSMVVEEAASVMLDAIARANGYTPAGDGDGARLT